VRRDAFAALRDGQQKEARKRAEGEYREKGKKKNLFVDEQAEESEEDERYNIRGMQRKGDSDGDDDDDDELGSVEDLVDDQKVPEPEQAEQDARAVERFRSVRSHVVVRGT
jgi:hypothetical protein